MKYELLLIVLALFTFHTWDKWRKEQSKENTFLLGFMILLSSILYSVLVLGLEVGGAYLSLKQIEEAKQEILASKEEVQKISEIVIKSSFVLADGMGRLGGFPLEHKEHLKAYTSELEKLAGKQEGEILKEVEGVIETINESIKINQK